MRLLSCGPFFVRSSGVDDFEAAVATYRAACLRWAESEDYAPAGRPSGGEKLAE